MTPGDIDEATVSTLSAEDRKQWFAAIFLGEPACTVVRELILRAEAAERVVTPICETAERLERELLAAQDSLRVLRSELASVTAERNFWRSEVGGGAA